MSWLRKLLQLWRHEELYRPSTYFQSGRKIRS